MRRGGELALTTCRDKQKQTLYRTRETHNQQSKVENSSEALPCTYRKLQQQHNPGMMKPNGAQIEIDDVEEFGTIMNQESALTKKHQSSSPPRKKHNTEPIRNTTNCMHNSEFISTFELHTPKFSRYRSMKEINEQCMQGLQAKFNRIPFFEVQT